MMPEPSCRECDHDEDAHSYSHPQASYWCAGCADWCDLDIPDPAPCCRAVVTSGDSSCHEPGCYRETA